MATPGGRVLIHECSIVHWKCNSLPKERGRRRPPAAVPDFHGAGAGADRRRTVAPVVASPSTAPRWPSAKRSTPSFGPRSSVWATVTGPGRTSAVVGLRGTSARRVQLLNSSRPARAWASHCSRASSAARASAVRRSLPEASPWRGPPAGPRPPTRAGRPGSARGRRLGVAAGPALLVRLADGLLHPAHGLLDPLEVAAGHLAGGLPLVLDRAQRRLGRLDVGDRQQRLGLREQLLLDLEVGLGTPRSPRPRPRPWRRRRRPARP